MSKKFIFNNTNDTTLKEYLEQYGTLAISDSQLNTEWINYCNATFGRLVAKTEHTMSEFAMWLSTQEV